MVYLDNAATSLERPPEVECACVTALREYAGYGRSGHEAAIKAAAAVYACRESLAELFLLPGAENVVFFGNCTTALNTAIFGLAPKKGSVVISAWEHNSVTRVAHALGCRGLQIVTAGGSMFNADAEAESFERALGGGCGLCVCTAVSNVFGNALPLAEIGAMCRRRGIPFVVDAAQAAGMPGVDAACTKADVICVPGHKTLMGPTGTGAMLLCTELRPEPLILGGTGTNSEDETQPDFPPERYESGTPNIPGICGLAAGVKYVAGRQNEIFGREAELRRYAEKLLAEAGAVVYAAPASASVGGLLSFNVPNLHSEATAARLAEKGIAVRAGLHCAPLAHRTAGTLETGTVRISFSPFTTEGDIEACAAAVGDIVRQA